MTVFQGTRKVQYSDLTLRLTWLGPKERPKNFSYMAEVRVGLSTRIIGHLFKFEERWYVARFDAAQARSLDTFGELREYLGLVGVEAA